VKITFISWVPYHRRTELLAQHLGATVHFVHYGQSGKLIQAPIRYVVQALRTWPILNRERPDVVLVQNPPIFAVLVTFLYSLRCSAQYVIDSHSGAFVSRKWRWSLGLHRVLSRGALTTIVHNKSQEEVVERWGCRYCVLGFTPGDYPSGRVLPLDGQFTVAMVCSFVDRDEPIGVVLEAARRLPKVSFYITGDYNCVPQQLLAQKPDNCCFTGYLPYDQYVGLLRGVDAIMVLTGFDETLLMGGFEAVSLGKPLITSGWPVLRDYFSLGTVHTDNTVEGICEGVRRAQSDYDALHRDMLRLRDQLEDEWRQKVRELEDLWGG
jgi:glycosyltransferase involved in cell wall biosynthesis